MKTTDTGLFNCIASNLAGQVVKKAYLRVSGRFFRLLVHARMRRITQENRPKLANHRKDLAYSQIFSGCFPIDAERVIRKNDGKMGRILPTTDTDNS